MYKGKPSDNRSEQAPEPRDGTGKWLPGRSGNPRGRPRSGNSLAEAIRSRVDPAHLVEIALRIAEDPDVKAGDRVAALQWLSKSAYELPVKRTEQRRLELVAGILPENFDKLSPQQRAELVDKIPLALPDGGE